MTDAVELRMQARRLGLSAPPIYWELEQDRLNRIYNGYGPDKWPECIRAVMTWFYRHFEAAASIHDVRYEFSDGTIAGWLTADTEIVANLKKQRDALYPWSKPWLYPFWVIATIKIKDAQWALELGGYTAYEAAFKRRSMKLSIRA